MRKASDNFKILTNDNQIVGISLGYDYCAEHEWGIKGIKNRFGIPEGTKKNMGIKSRTTTKYEDVLVFKEETYKKKKFAVLYTKSYFDDEIPYDLQRYKEDILWNVEWDEKKNKKPEDRKDALITAWDEGSFGIGVMGEEEVQGLKNLYEAFLNKNVVIAFTKFPNNPFTGTSLCLMIADRVPAEIIDQMYYADKEFYDREDYEEKIGMKEVIEKYGNKNGYKGRGYFMACSPKWICYDNEEARERQKKVNNTEYDILYWINYSDDDDNYGWHTVEQIREWLTGDKKLTEVAPKEKKK
ncbi:MAG: hypothetical protein ACOC22_01600 [bacterium]